MIILTITSLFINIKNTNSIYWILLISAALLIGFFFWGFSKIGKITNNKILRISSIFISIIFALMTYVVLSPEMIDAGAEMSMAIYVLGLFLIVPLSFFSYSLFKIKSEYGDLAKYSGIAGFVTGITTIFLVGIYLTPIYFILLIFLLLKISKKMPKESSIPKKTVKQIPYDSNLSHSKKFVFSKYFLIFNLIVSITIALNLILGCESNMFSQSSGPGSCDIAIPGLDLLLLLIQELLVILVYLSIFSFGLPLLGYLFLWWFSYHTFKKGIDPAKKHIFLRYVLLPLLLPLLPFIVIVLKHWITR